MAKKLIFQDALHIDINSIYDVAFEQERDDIILWFNEQCGDDVHGSPGKAPHRSIPTQGQAGIRESIKVFLTRKFRSVFTPATEIVCKEALNAFLLMTTPATIAFIFNSFLTSPLHCENIQDCV